MGGVGKDLRRREAFWSGGGAVDFPAFYSYACPKPLLL
ncbi:hypothetical protein X772_13690 [Mesorhizobium sp. LSJC280B00]|nr:hypothetical protein X772_13690 [Mesorhizobium sp. LSJC280B00]